jgi:putative transposase
MSRGKKPTAEQIICKFREAEIAISQGQTALAAKSIGVTYQTYCRWRKEYGGIHSTIMLRLVVAQLLGNADQGPVLLT